MKARELLEVATLTHSNLKPRERITKEKFFLLEPLDIIRLGRGGETRDDIVLLWQQENEWTYTKRESFTGNVKDYKNDPSKRRWVLKQSALPDMDAVYQGKF